MSNSVWKEAAILCYVVSTEAQRQNVDLIWAWRCVWWLGGFSDCVWLWEENQNTQTAPLYWVCVRIKKIAHGSSVAGDLLCSHSWHWQISFAIGSHVSWRLHSFFHFWWIVQSLDDPCGLFECFRMFPETNTDSKWSWMNHRISLDAYGQILSFDCDERNLIF